MSWKTRISTLVLLIAALLALSRLAPPDGDARPAYPPEERAWRVAIEPLRGFLIPFYWYACTAAMGRQDTRQALEFGRRLLDIHPGDPDLWNQLMVYLSQGAVNPLLEESPPRVDDAYEYIEESLQLGLEALERYGLKECYQMVAIILLELQADYRGEYGLAQRYERIHGEPPLRTLVRLRERFGKP